MKLDKDWVEKVYEIAAKYESEIDIMTSNKNKTEKVAELEAKIFHLSTFVQIMSVHLKDAIKTSETLNTIKEIVKVLESSLEKDYHGVEDYRYAFEELQKICLK